MTSELDIVGACEQIGIGRILGKLAEGIRKLHADTVKLEKMLTEQLPAVAA